MNVESGVTFNSSFPSDDGPQALTLLAARGLRADRVQSKAEYQIALELREQIYWEAGKVADFQRYQSPLDVAGDVFIVRRDGLAIGTFSIYRHRKGGLTEPMISRSTDTAELGDGRAIYVYFLGLVSEQRTAGALKFVFGEIFKFLVREERDTIFISADARLARKYKWIGFRDTGVRVTGPFPKSGTLALMRTRQMRLGVYGLHADPIRWNVYLREPTRELLVQGAFRNPRTVASLVFIYGFFAGLTFLYEKAASRFWKTTTARSRSRNEASKS